MSTTTASVVPPGIDVPADLRPYLETAARVKIEMAADNLARIVEGHDDEPYVARMEEVIAIWRAISTEADGEVEARAVSTAARWAGDEESEKLAEDDERDDGEVLASVHLIWALAQLRRDAAMVALGAAVTA